MYLASSGQCICTFWVSSISSTVTYYVAITKNLSKLLLIFTTLYRYNYDLLSLKFWAIWSKTLIIFFAYWKNYPKLGNRWQNDRWWMINVSCKSSVKEPPFITVTILSCLSCTECHIGHLIVVTHFSKNSFQSCKNRNWKTLCQLKKKCLYDIRGYNYLDVG